MFRAHSLHSVRQQHHKPRLPHPLRLAAGDELVNDALGSVGKVPELALPQHQGIGVGHGVAEFKSKDAIFRERAVADGVGCLVRVQVGQRVVGRPEQTRLLWTHLIVVALFYGFYQDRILLRCQIEWQKNSANQVHHIQSGLIYTVHGAELSHPKKA